jgi:phenylalanyl-tRNA synthetase beta chain
MLISLAWLKKYVDIPVDTKAFVDDLTMLGLNVEHVTALGFDNGDVVVGRVLEASGHPNADRLTVCSVDVGTAEPLEIVCGAPNVAAGQYVPVALNGATLPNGMKIKKSKIRGVVSNGMICSEIELGLGDDAEGIMVLEEEREPGTPLADVLSTSDTVLEIEVTPNRPDQLSHLGVAREVGALYSTPVRYPYRDVPRPEGDGRLVVDIADPLDCYRYTGRIVRGVKVSRSPSWLRSALEAVGQNSINNVVDLANYVMLETGQPLHAFDVAKLGGVAIGVRRARDGERLVALDGVDYELKPNYLIITEGDRPVAVAGVIGGMETGVTEQTGAILIESAAFAPRVVRETRKGMNINTEASYRFERGCDREGCITASDRFCELVLEVAGGEVGEVVDAYPNPWEERVVRIRRSNTQRILGVQLESGEIRDFLERLHFNAVGATHDHVDVTVPPYRGDIVEEMDLIEEVARVYGYERIGKGWSFRTTTYAQRDSFDEFCRSIADHLVARGFTETLTSSFTDGSEVELMDWPEGDLRRRLISIRNPLTSHQRFLRTSPLPAVLELMRRNIDYGAREVAVFTMGKVFIPAAEASAGSGSSGLPDERTVLLIALTRPSGKDFWNQVKLSTDLFDIKEEIETLSASQKVDIGSRLTYDFEDGTGRFTLRERGTPVVEGGIVPAKLARAYEFQQAVWYAAVDLEELHRLRVTSRKFKPLPEFPVSKRDLSLVTPAGVTFGEVEKCLVKYGGRLLESVQPFDVYRGKRLPERSTAFGVRLLFRSPERTLRDSEIDEIVEKIIHKLQSELSVSLRA